MTLLERIAEARKPDPAVRLRSDPPEWWDGDPDVWTDDGRPAPPLDDRCSYCGREGHRWP